MRRRLLIALVLVWGAAGGLVQAQSLDRVKQGRSSVSGKVVEISPLKVKVEQGSGTKEIEVREITGIAFHGEPNELTTARLNIDNGNYEKGKELLAKIDRTALKGFVKQEVDFYGALCDARLALGGAGSISVAGKAMYNFEQANPTSYHHFAACEVLGDLFVASGKYELAEEQYGQLGKAPWPDYKMKAGVLVGRALQAQKKHQEALAEFDKVLTLARDDKSAEAQRQQLGATLGKAISLSETEQVTPAVAMVEQVIAQAGPEEMELHARAYNALGQCYLKADKPKEALLAFLHVDVLYNALPEAHAEALANLARLWESIGKGERAREASAVLKQRYPNSRWANQ